MAKKKVVGTNLDQNLNGVNFYSTVSETIFQFGSFSVTSNFTGRKPIDYTNTLDSFVRPVSLETLGVTNAQSSALHQYQVNAVLNLDKSNLNTFVRFGSTYEFFRVNIQEIILNYPGSLFCNSNIIFGGNPTIFNYSYDITTNESLIQIPSNCIVNTFSLVFNMGNVSEPNGMVIKNLNLSYEKYVIWSKHDVNNSYNIIGFTGDTSGIPYVWIKTVGNPFWFNTGMTNRIDFHIKPNNIIFEDFRSLLTNYEQYIVSERQSTNGFQFTINEPTLLEDGNITYNTITMLWNTTDGYNIDINTSLYQKFLTSMLNVGAKYDSVKTDLIARFLTPASIKTYDLTENGKMTKLLRVYGWEFDQIRNFIDSLVNINSITYNKLNNIPDQLVSNLAKTFGWEYFTLVNETELVDNFLSIDNTERNLNSDLMPSEINIELWRRILLNTNYLWKSKGTRAAIKSMFLLIGIPEPFINITEYVYTVAGKINPNSVQLTQADFPSNSLPYDNSGYPVAPVETTAFYFQMSGNTDSGQAYMDVFRKAGFNLMRTIDNKKSWIQTGATTRIHYSTPQYIQGDSKLILNTKEVDVALDTARGIEYDVYDYIQKDFAVNSSGYTLPYSYVNVSLNVTGATQSEFTLPYDPSKIEGYLEVRYNGILLTPSTFYSGGTNLLSSPPSPYNNDYDYTVVGNKIYLSHGNIATNTGNRRDVIQVTLVYSGGTHPVTGITVQYIVARITPTLAGPGTKIQLPSYPRGDVQVTINGIALTKGTGQFTADYIIDPNNSPTGSTNNIIIQNPEVIAYLASMVNNNVVVAYMEVHGSNEINARNEVVRVDSFNSSKIYFNVSANKYVYKMNYKANSASDIKVLVDGIALEPYMDYGINPMNLYEILLPKGINYGSVISVYYLVGGSAHFTPVVNDSFGVGDISKLSFLEFIELIQRKLINAKTRKTISDFKGGWYPTLLNVYIQYLVRGRLSDNNPLHSNGYTFENLYPFLSKYNAFFQRFVDSLLSSTIILNQSGLLVRNSVFTKQKFTYKRGVNIYSGNTYTKDLRNAKFYQYLGNDGSTFYISQDINPIPPVPPVLFVNTKIGNPGIGSIIGFGGKDITCSTGLENITEYGVEFRIGNSDPWMKVFESGSITVDNFSMSKIGLLEGSTYMYRAYVKVDDYGASGNTEYITTNIAPPVPSISTKLGTVSTDSITSGGYNIVGWETVSQYGMQYKTGVGTWITTALTPGPMIESEYNHVITSLSANTIYDYRAYMIIDGTEIFGDIKSITTTAIPIFAPTVNMIAISGITQISAIGGGNVTSDGGATVTVRGLCWGLSPNPTIANSHSTNGSGTGIFTGNIVSLVANTTYYVRAYATNSVGTSYSVQSTFETNKIAEIYFATTNGNLGVNNQNGQIYDLKFKYYIEASCDNEQLPADPNQATTTLNYSIDGGVTWTGIDSVSASVPSGGPLYDLQTKSGTFEINGISNVSNVIVSGNYDYWNGANAKNGAYYAIITGVTANTDSVIIICPDKLNVVGSDNQPESLECNQSIITQPTVTTTSITSIAYKTAIGGGNVTNNGGASVIERGICFSAIHDTPTIDDSRVVCGSGNGIFTANIINLVPNVKYYVRAYARNIGGIGYGSVVSFTTLKATITLTPSSLTFLATDESQAKEKTFVVTSNQSSLVVENYSGGIGNWFTIRNGSNNELYDGMIIYNDEILYAYPNTQNTGVTRSVTINNLLRDVDSTVFAQFTITQDAPLPITPILNSISSISDTAATFYGTISNDSLISGGFCWSISHNPTIDDNISTDGTPAGIFNHTVNNLTPGTTYYVRVYATNISGTGYSIEQSFTTLTTPTVTTTAISSISYETAVGGGNVTNDGGANVIERGICFSAIHDTPTISDSVITSGSGTGAYVSYLNNIVAGTLYYVRAYAKNSVGVSYGSVVSFETLQPFISLSKNTFAWDAIYAGEISGFTVSTSADYLEALIGTADWLGIESSTQGVLYVGDRVYNGDEITIHPTSTNLGPSRSIVGNFVKIPNTSIFAGITVTQSASTQGASVEIQVAGKDVDVLSITGITAYIDNNAMDTVYYTMTPIWIDAPTPFYNLNWTAEGYDGINPIPVDLGSGTISVTDMIENSGNLILLEAATPGMNVIIYFSLP